MENINIKDIRELSLKNTIRVLKDHRVYHIFRCFIASPINSPYHNLHIKAMKRIQSAASKYHPHNPFHNAMCPKELLNVMEELENNNMFVTKPDLSNPKMVQNIVMTHVNNLLHYCVERGVNDISIMEVLGREAFENTCKAILGEDFIDEMNQGPAPISEMDPEEREKIIKMVLDGTYQKNAFLDAIFNGEYRTEVRDDFFGRLSTHNNIGTMFDYEYDDDDDLWHT